MVCPNCNQQPISPIRFILKFNQTKIKCKNCGVDLRGGKLLRGMFYGALIFGLILGLSVAILGDIYNLGFAKSLMIAFVVISIFGIPAEFIGWKYGHYETQETNTTQVSIIKKFLGIFLWLVPLLVILFVLFFFIFLKPIQIMGKSMEPNYPDRQRYLVEKWSYIIGDPQRGDVIVYHYPKDERYKLIYRVVALPGETVKIEQGSVFVNRQRLSELYVLGKTETEQSLEGQEIRVPENTYYVLGDNREQAFKDSRESGPIPRKNIIGKIWIRY